MYNEHTNPGSSQQMMEMITAYWVTLVARGAAHYSLADHLELEPTTARTFAEALARPPRTVNKCQTKLEYLNLEGAERSSAARARALDRAIRGPKYYRRNAFSVRRHPTVTASRYQRSETTTTRSQQLARIPAGKAEPTSSSLRAAVAMAPVIRTSQAARAV